MSQIREQVAKWLANIPISTAAAVIFAIGVVLVDLRQEDRYDYQEMLAEFRAEITRLRDIERTCNEAMLENGRKISVLQNKIIMLESAQMSSPLPMWLKSAGTDELPGVMLAVNDAYERLYLLPFGKTADDYVGRTDREMWGEQLGAEYWENDLAVIRSQEPVDAMATDPVTGEKNLRIIKYPRMFGGRIVGVAGVAIPKKD